MNDEDRELNGEYDRAGLVNDQAPTRIILQWNSTNHWTSGNWINSRFEMREYQPFNLHKWTPFSDQVKIDRGLNIISIHSITN